ncbi:hypothetical protein EVAR_40357_1 [Eumeta japonica]|uniref:Uncharacterized protein n=1 Tax=Eumeta variegata TaxID=151549 RepID=A0A4C1XNC7_EUMVA|nr:hypothetical protein EVAR_40357_1 [Eumeta japonica]
MSFIACSKGERAGKPSKNKLSPPPMDTRNPKGVTSASLASWKETGYIMDAATSVHLARAPPKLIAGLYFMLHKNQIRSLDKPAAERLFVPVHFGQDKK